MTAMCHKTHACPKATVFLWTKYGHKKQKGDWMCQISITHMYNIYITSWNPSAGGKYALANDEKETNV